MSWDVVTGVECIKRMLCLPCCSHETQTRQAKVLRRWSNSGYLVLVLAGVARVHCHHRAIHMQLPHDADLQVASGRQRQPSAQLSCVAPTAAARDLMLNNSTVMTCM